MKKFVRIAKSIGLALIVILAVLGAATGLGAFIAFLASLPVWIFGMEPFESSMLMVGIISLLTLIGVIAHQIYQKQ